MKFIRLLKNNSKNYSYLLLDKKKIKCKVGKNGVGKKVREGDLITPKGVFSLKKVLFRADKIQRPKTSLKIIKIQKFDFWCSDPRSLNYNKLVKKNQKFKCEKMYRDDSLYDLVIEISFNTKFVRKYKGSAIFIHCYEQKNNFTEGCISLEKNDLLSILSLISKTTKIIID